MKPNTQKVFLRNLLEAFAILHLGQIVSRKAMWLPIDIYKNVAMVSASHVFTNSYYVARSGEFIAMALAETRRAVKKILRGLRVLNKDWRIHVGKVLP